MEKLRINKSSQIFQVNHRLIWISAYQIESFSPLALECWNSCEREEMIINGVGKSGRASLDPDPDPITLLPGNRDSNFCFSEK